MQIRSPELEAITEKANKWLDEYKDELLNEKEKLFITEAYLWKLTLLLNEKSSKEEFNTLITALEEACKPFNHNEIPTSKQLSYDIHTYQEVMLYSALEKTHLTLFDTVINTYPKDQESYLHSLIKGYLNNDDLNAAICLGDINFFNNTLNVFIKNEAENLKAMNFKNRLMLACKYKRVEFIKALFNVCKMHSLTSGAINIFPEAFATNNIQIVNLFLKDIEYDIDNYCPAIENKGFESVYQLAMRLGSENIRKVFTDLKNKQNENKIESELVLQDTNNNSDTESEDDYFTESINKLVIEQSKNDKPTTSWEISYQLIWDKKEYVDDAARTIALLKDYSGEGGTFSAFLKLSITGHFNRHHTTSARECTDFFANKSASVYEILLDLNNRITDTINPKGSLNRRLEFIENKTGVKFGKIIENKNTFKG